jgi:hypothetical protein
MAGSGWRGGQQTINVCYGSIEMSPLDSEEQTLWRLADPLCANSRHRDVASSRNLFRYFDRFLRCRLTRSRLGDCHWIWYTLGYIKRN